MIHLNQLAKEQLWWGGLADFFLPEMYHASTITDFLENKQNIEMTSLRKTVLGMMSSIYRGCAIVGFNNLNLEIKPKGFNLSDSTGNLFVYDASPYIPHDSANGEKLSNGIYYEANIVFYKKHDLAWLRSTKKHGPASVERSRGLAGIISGISLSDPLPSLI